MDRTRTPGPFARAAQAAWRALDRRRGAAAEAEALAAGVAADLDVVAASVRGGQGRPGRVPTPALDGVGKDGPPLAWGRLALVLRARLLYRRLLQDHPVGGPLAAPPTSTLAVLDAVALARAALPQTATASPVPAAHRPPN